MSENARPSPNRLLPSRYKRLTPPWSTQLRRSPSEASGLNKAPDDLLAKARRQATRGHAEPAPTRDRSRPVRITLDLAPVMHCELTNWCADAAEQLGAPQVPAVAVVQALLRELTTDAEMTARVLARLPQELDR